MLPMNHPIAQENIRRHISPAQIYDDLFDEEELDDIWKSAFDARNNVRRNRNGTVLMVGLIQDLMKYMNDTKLKLLKWLVKNMPLKHQA